MNMNGTRAASICYRMSSGTTTILRVAHNLFSQMKKDLDSIDKFIRHIAKNYRIRIGVILYQKILEPASFKIQKGLSYLAQTFFSFHLSLYKTSDFYLENLPPNAVYCVKFQKTPVLSFLLISSYMEPLKTQISYRLAVRQPVARL